MANKGKQNSFVMQAGILAAAGIICKIIGILYRSPPLSGYPYTLLSIPSVSAHSVIPSLLCFSHLRVW